MASEPTVSAAGGAQLHMCTSAAVHYCVTVCTTVLTCTITSKHLTAVLKAHGSQAVPCDASNQVFTPTVGQVQLRTCVNFALMKPSLYAPSAGERASMA
jgi:hypothetical protein